MIDYVTIKFVHVVIPSLFDRIQQGAILLIWWENIWQHRWILVLLDTPRPLFKPRLTVVGLLLWCEGIWFGKNRYGIIHYIFLLNSPSPNPTKLPYVHLCYVLSRIFITQLSPLKCLHLVASTLPHPLTPSLSQRSNTKKKPYSPAPGTAALLNSLQD